MTIKELEAEERPRERMEKWGAGSLSTAELLAILLRTGQIGRNAVDIARDLLKAAKGRLELLALQSPAQMCGVAGVGPGKAMTIAAAFELGRRLAAEQTKCKARVVSEPATAAALLWPNYTTEDREECWCMYLRRNKMVIAIERISEGGETLTEIDIKQIVRRSLELKAAAVILSHNHPSGNPTPSKADLDATTRLRCALGTFDLSLLDHIIIAREMFYSFDDQCVQAFFARDTHWP